MILSPCLNKKMKEQKHYGDTPGRGTNQADQTAANQSQTSDPPPKSRAWKCWSLLLR